MSAAPVIIAHRGLHDVHPENSLAAFRAAWDAGVAWCECDVQVTADHRTVVIHDGTLDRTTSGAGTVRHKVWENLRKCRLRDRHGRTTDEALPLLSDVLAAMPTNCGMLVELKTSMPLFHHMARAYMQRGARCMLHSFDTDTVRALCENGLASHTAMLIDDLANLGRAAETGCHGLHVRHDLLDERVAAEVRGFAKWLGVWTPSTDRDLRRSIDLGVDLLITDDPRSAHAIVQER